MMLAVLPRQNADDVSGELFVEAYERHLGGYPAEQIEYICDQAIATQKWFPTVSDCHDLAGGFRRQDWAVQRRRLASQAMWKEKDIREPNGPGWKPKEPWKPLPGEIEQIHKEAADKLRVSKRRESE